MPTPSARAAWQFSSLTLQRLALFYTQLFGTLHAACLPSGLDWRSRERQSTVRPKGLTCPGQDCALFRFRRHLAALPPSFIPFAAVPFLGPARFATLTTFIRSVVFSPGSRLACSNWDFLLNAPGFVPFILIAVLYIRFIFENLYFHILSLLVYLDASALPGLFGKPPPPFAARAYPPWVRLLFGPLVLRSYLAAHRSGSSKKQTQ